MEKAKIGDKYYDIKYKTHSGMRTVSSFEGKTYRLGLSVNVYDVVDREEKVLVLQTANGQEILQSTTVVSAEKYAEIADLYDPYHEGRYHTALLEECGAKNHLEVM